MMEADRYARKNAIPGVRTTLLLALASVAISASTGCSGTSSLAEDADSESSSSKVSTEFSLGRDALGLCYRAVLAARGLFNRSSLQAIADREGLELAFDARASIDAWPSVAFGEAASDIDACRASN